MLRGRRETIPTGDKKAAKAERPRQKARGENGNHPWLYKRYSIER